MTAFGLIDTSAVIALLNRDEPRHDACADALSNLNLPLGLTQAVMTEIFYFLTDDQRRRADAWRLVRSEVIEMLPIRADDFSDLEALMDKYADRPMDYADATLVRVAEREALSTILTLDRADFATYRIAGRRRFRIFPEW